MKFLNLFYFVLIVTFSTPSFTQDTNDENVDQELKLSQSQELDERKVLMNNSMGILNQREKEILTARRLSEDVSTLEDLSTKYKISRERVRQIETKAFEKLQKAILNAAKSNNLLIKN